MSLFLLLAAGRPCPAYAALKASVPSNVSRAGGAWSAPQRVQFIQEVTLHLAGIANRLLAPGETAHGLGALVLPPAEAAAAYLQEHLADPPAEEPRRVGQEVILDALAEDLLPMVAQTLGQVQSHEAPGSQEAAAQAARLEGALRRFGGDTLLALRQAAFSLGQRQDGAEPSQRLSLHLRRLYDGGPEAEVPPRPPEIPEEDWARLRTGATHWGKVSLPTQALLLRLFFSEVRAAYPAVRKWRDLRAIHFRDVQIPALGKNLEGLYAYYSKRKDRPKGKDVITFLLEQTGILKERPAPGKIRTLEGLLRRIRTGEFRGGSLPWEDMSPALQRQLLQELADKLGKSVTDLTSDHDFKTPLDSIGQSLRGLMKYYERLLGEQGLAKVKTTRWFMLETLGYIPADPSRPLPDLGSLRRSAQLRTLLAEKAIFDVPWDALVEVNSDFLRRLVRELAAAKRLLAASADGSPPSERSVEEAVDSVTPEELGALTREDYESVVLPGLGRPLKQFYDHFVEHKFQEHGVEAKPTVAYILETLGLIRPTPLVQEAYTLESIQVARSSRGLPKSFWRILPNSARRAGLHYLGQHLSPARSPDAVSTDHYGAISIPALGGTLQGMLDYYARDSARPSGQLHDYILDAIGFVRTPQALVREARRLAEAEANVPVQDRPLYESLSGAGGSLEAGAADRLRQQLDAALVRARRALRRGRDVSVRKWKEALESFWSLWDTAEWTHRLFSQALAGTVAQLAAKPPTAKRHSPLWAGLQTVARFYPDRTVAALEGILAQDGAQERSALDILRRSPVWSPFANELRQRASRRLSASPLFGPLEEDPASSPRRRAPSRPQVIRESAPAGLLLPGEQAVPEQELQRRRRVLDWSKTESELSAGTYSGLREEVMVRFEQLTQAAVRRMAFRYRGNPLVDQDDMGSIATLAKRAALDRYDPAEGGDFRKYLSARIQDAIREEVRSTGREKRGVTETRRQLMENPELAQGTADEIAEALGVRRDTVLAAQRSAVTPSLDAEFREDEGGSLKDGLDAADADPSDIAARRDLFAALTRDLDPEELSLLTLRFRDGLSPREIAQELDKPQDEVEESLEALTRRLAEGAARRGMGP